MEYKSIFLPVLEVVHVDGIASVGVTAGELVDVAGELVIADKLVKSVAIRVGIIQTLYERGNSSLKEDDEILGELCEIGVRFRA